MSEPITISEEARKAAEAELSAAYTRRHIAAHEENEKGFACQIAINSATAPLQKRIEELEKQLLAMREALDSGQEIIFEGFYHMAIPVDTVTNILEATLSDLSRKYVKRKVLEKIKHYAAHMPSCYAVTGMIHCNCGFAETIALARKELEK